MSIPHSPLVRRVLYAAKQRKGFALPLAILIIAALTATLAAAFSSVTAEIATNSAQRSESRAFVLAESGLEEYIARRTYHCTARTGYAPVCGKPPLVQTESVTVTLPGGYAIVTSTKSMSGFGAQRGAMYLIKSRGIDTISTFNGATRAIYGERIVAQYAMWNQKTIQVLSALTSLAGVDKTGAAGVITGFDNCPAVQGGGLPPLAGISAPTGTINVSGGVTLGSPAQQGLGTQAQADSTIKIDWNGIVSSPSAVTADYTFAYNATIPSALTTFWATDTTYYPVLHVTGNGTWSLPAGGRGFLILDGDADMGHGGWTGIMLAGGTIRGNGTDHIYGAMITGMNMKLTPAQHAATGLPAPNQGDDLRGVKDYYFDSCAVTKAASALGSFVVIPNAWMDNFSTY
jgi:hypothetical protein